MNNEVVKKIKKLLALCESSNEHEAKLAMLKAQELLVKHKLSMREIKSFKYEPVNISKIRSKISFTRAKWKINLAYVIAENFGCYHFAAKKHNRYVIAFLGKEEDINVCNIVLEYAIDCIDSVVKKLRTKYRGYSTKGLQEDYALGFIEGISNAFERQKQQNQEWGLVLTKDKNVIDAYENIKFAGTVETQSRFNGFNEAYQNGLEDGEKFSISDKIARADEEVLQLYEIHN